MHPQTKLLTQGFLQLHSQEGTCPSTRLGSLNQREQFPKRRMGCTECIFLLLDMDSAANGFFLFNLKSAKKSVSGVNLSLGKHLMPLPCDDPTGPIEWPDLAKNITHFPLDLFIFRSVSLDLGHENRGGKEWSCNGVGASRTPRQKQRHNRMSPISGLNSSPHPGSRR